MWKLKVYIDTDKDFSYKSKNNIIDVDYIIFKNRDLAVNKLLNFYKDLCETINCDNDKKYMLDNIIMIKNFKSKLELLLHKYHSLRIEFELGNPTIILDLSRMNILSMDDDEICCREYNQLSLYINHNFEKDYNWELIEKQIPDYKEEINNEII